MEQNIIVESMIKDLVLNYKDILFKVHYEKIGDNPYKYKLYEYKNYLGLCRYKSLFEKVARDDWHEIDINYEVWTYIKNNY